MGNACCSPESPGKPHGEAAPLDWSLARVEDVPVFIPLPTKDESCQEKQAESQMSTEAPPFTEESSVILPPGQKLTVMMFGMTGSGKSSLGNLIAGSHVFHAGDDTASMTNLDSVMRYESEDASLVILDTIGLGDTEIDQEKVVASIRDVALSAINGVDILLFVMRNTRITDDAIMRLIYVVECLWGNDCLMNLYVVVTCAGRYLRSRSDAEEWIQRQVEINWRFKRVFELVSNNANRFLFVDNPDLDCGEPCVEERRQLSYDSVMHMLAAHPREIIPPFTHAMMKKAQELTEVERKDLEAKEVTVQRIQEKLGRPIQPRARRWSKSKGPTRVPSSLQVPTSEDTTKSVDDMDGCQAIEKTDSVTSAFSRQISEQSSGGNTVDSADLEKAMNDKLASEKALQSKLKQVGNDESFLSGATAMIELSMIRFNDKLANLAVEDFCSLPSSPSTQDSTTTTPKAKAKAGQRMLAMMKTRAASVRWFRSDNGEAGTSSRCATNGCIRKSWNGKVGQRCCRTCKGSDGVDHGLQCNAAFQTTMQTTMKNVDLSKPHVTEEQMKRAIDDIVARLQGAFAGRSSKDVYQPWDDPACLNPIRFHNLLKTGVVQDSLNTAPRIVMQPNLVAGLWRRADVNCDGKVDFREFSALLGDV